MVYRTLKGFEAKQLKLIEACEIVQTHAVKMKKEVDEKWKAAGELRQYHQDLERKLCASNGMA